MERNSSEVENPKDTGEILGRGEKIKETVSLGLLNVVLPSITVFSALALAIRLYWDGNDNYIPFGIDLRTVTVDFDTENDIYTQFGRYGQYACGTMVLVPLLLNYLICWYIWATTDKRKSYTWVAALLGFYPQFVACKAILLIWTDPKGGLQEKKQLESNLEQVMLFCGRVPSAIVMICIFYFKNGLKDSEVAINLFWVALSTSAITSSLGLAKTLKTGPCRILPEQKRFLGGLLSHRFILIFFACGLALFAKGSALAVIAQGWQGGHTTEYMDWEGMRAPGNGFGIALSTVFLPGILTNLFSCWHKGILKTFVAHPFLFFLPSVSYFTYASNSKVGSGGKTDSVRGVGCTQEESFIAFSPEYTAINAGLSVIAGIVWASTQSEASDIIVNGLITFTPGLLLSLAIAFSNQIIKSCRRCCCSSSTESFGRGALLVSSPHTPYILGTNGQLRREETDGGLEEEMVENVDIVEAAKMEEEMGAMVEKVDIEEAAQHVVP